MDRSERRHRAQKKAAKRIRKWKSCANWEMTEKQKGQARKENFSCGCIMCKPWKHGKKS